MRATIDGIPVYEALLSDEECGMVRISLVDAPAVLTAWQAFKAEKKMLFKVQDEEQRLVRGVVMRADFPIYRRQGNFEYYIVYKADTIREMAEKYLAESRQNKVDEMHNENDVEGVQMVQYFIKDSSKGIVPEGFDEIADGSLFAEFHITNDEVWEKVKDGTYTGFSLEGVFGAVPEENQREIDDIVEELDGKFNELDKQEKMSKIQQIKEHLAAKLEAEVEETEQKFGAVTTDKGVLSWDGEEDLKEGDKVYVVDEGGNRVDAEDGEYMTEDSKVIVVVDGVVSELRDPEAEVAPEQEEEVEQEVEEEVEEEDFKSKYEESLATIETLNAELESVRAEVAELRKENEKLSATPAAKPAHEEVKESVTFHKTGDKGLDTLAAKLALREKI